MAIKTSNNPNGAGRPTDLTEKMFKEIRQGVLDGKTFKEIANIIGKTVEVLYVWHSANYLGLADKISMWKLDRKLMLANKNIEEFLEMNTMNTGTTKKGDKFDFNDTGLVRVKADISKFVAETLGKENYSKRNELSGPGGKEFQPLIVKFIKDEVNKDEAKDEANDNTDRI